MANEETRKDLASYDPDDGPYVLCADCLEGLVASDLPRGVEIEVERSDDDNNFPSAFISRGTDSPLEIIFREDLPVKHWDCELSVSRYLRLMEKILRHRQEAHSDVRIDSSEICDDRWYHLHYAVLVQEEGLSEAWTKGLAIHNQIRKEEDEQTAIILSAVNKLI